MDKKPVVHHLKSGASYWKATFSTFSVLVYNPVPPEELHSNILNYGFDAPYLLVFSPEKPDPAMAESFAASHRLTELAAAHASSIAYIYPTARGGWQNAAPDIFSEIISNSKIHQYYKDGYVEARNRFTGTTDGWFIRGAIFRTCLFGFGPSADYIARNCLCHFEGDGLWGRADIAPVTCFLSGLSTEPVLAADDIPVVSYGNSERINALFQEKCRYFKKGDGSSIPEDFYSFAKRFRRMLGKLDIDPDLKSEGLVREPGVATVNTSPDNNGDDCSLKRHRIGYFAFYNKDLFKNGKVPLVLGFHGGGDSCFFFSTMAGWAKIAHRHNFLLVTVEDHLNSTATEMLALIRHLKKKYPIDTSRIYATGFSMGGCKTWDMVQEFPSVIAAAAPMDATFEVGLNLYGKPAGNPLNETVPVPVFYAGGEITPLPELPFQAQKCIDRMAYILRLNKVKTEYNVNLAEKESWKNPIWGIDGDTRLASFDESRGSTLTMELFTNEEGRILNVFGSISEQGHDCREHTCEHAWRFMNCFSRNRNGKLKGGSPKEILESLKD